MRTGSTKVMMAVLAAAIFSSYMAWAITGVWQGGVGGEWHDEANWVDGVTPTVAGQVAGGGDVADFTQL